MNDEKRLVELIEKTVSDMEHAEIKIDELSEEYKLLGEKICLWLKKTQEIYKFTEAMADGEFDIDVPERHNYLAGPIKDLYYKFQHLTWQANQVAKGDYSQRVDFMGRFSESFNCMVQELEKREKMIKKHAEDMVKNAEKQNKMLKRQLIRQTANYQSYRSYTKSFVDFREHYKEMMGQVYDLFNKGKYEEGRMLVARINDMMKTEVDIRKVYSDDDFLNSALLEIANYCQCYNIKFNACVHVPEDFDINGDVMEEYLMYFSEILIALLELEDVGERCLDIRGNTKDNWLNIIVEYSAEHGLKDYLYEENGSEFFEYAEKLKRIAVNNNDLFEVKTDEKTHKLKMLLHASENE